LIVSWGEKIRFSGRTHDLRRGERVRTVGAFVCLIALMAQLCLPSVHTLQFIAKEAAAAPLRSWGHSCLLDQREAPARIADSTPGHASHHSRHDPGSCPVCQTLLHSSRFIAPLCSIALPIPAAAGAILPGYLDTAITGCKPSSYIPRAPPPFP